MSTILQISSFSNLNLLGTRFIAKKIRASIEDALTRDDSVELDLSGVEVTQSFIDELLGPIILRIGPSLLGQLAFRGCSEGAQAVIRFVVVSRLADFRNAHPQGPINQPARARA